MLFRDKLLLMKYRSNLILAISLFSALSLFSLAPLSGIGQTGGRPRAVTGPTPVSPTPTPTATPASAQTIETLQTKIRQRLFAPEVRRGRVGIKIASLNTGKVIFESDSEKYFMPASNMKNFTVAAAIEKLTPDFRFVTTVKAPSSPDAAGTVNGNLTVVGSGDITVSNAFDPAFPQVVNHYWGVDKIASAIATAGVKRIEGDLVADESYFRGYSLPATWEWDDLQSYYGAGISALPFNDNAVDLSVIPGSAGNQCIIRVSPVNTLIRIVNKCTTAAKGSKRSVVIFKHLDENVIDVSGMIAAGDAEYKESVAITRPAELLITLLKQRLESKGIVVTGNARLADNTLQTICPTCPPPASVIVSRIESPPLSVIAAKTMKPSQNMYTETLLWTLGEQVGRKSSQSGDSAALGLTVVRAFLKDIGIAPDSVVQYDGSGLSRHDLITPSAVVALYTYMAKQSRFSQVWRDSLTIGGVDGTLRNRFKGTAASGNIRGKTGTIDQVSALSGYITTAGGEQLVLSILVNGVPELRNRLSLIDGIVVDLANFDGKADQN
jgi:D-alanyl-D-alanine carboxypeptidase/D-alanyl-D-alanine-endopeptidase (penicillin-binding protein 4)